MEGRRSEARNERMRGAVISSMGHTPLDGCQVILGGAETNFKNFLVFVLAQRSKNMYTYILIATAIRRSSRVTQR